MWWIIRCKIITYDSKKQTSLGEIFWENYELQGISDIDSANKTINLPAGKPQDLYEVWKMGKNLEIRNVLGESGKSMKRKENVWKKSVFSGLNFECQNTKLIMLLSRDLDSVYRLYVGI